MIARLVAVWVVMVVLPVAVVWWSCRVAPPVLPPRRYVSLLDMIRVSARVSREFEETYRRVQASFEATADDIARLAEAARRSL